MSKSYESASLSGTNRLDPDTDGIVRMKETRIGSFHPNNVQYGLEEFQGFFNDLTDSV